MANIYWSEQDVARWYIYSKRRGYMAQADTEDDARLIVAGLEALEAQQPAAAVPEGYALVPVEPTDEMVFAGMDALSEARRAMASGEGRSPISETYRAMLAAAERKGE